VLSHVGGPDGCRRIGTKRVKGDARADDPETTNGTRPGGFVDTGAESGSGKPNAAVHGDEEIEAWECAPGCPVAELDRQSGQRKGGSPIKGRPVAWMADERGGSVIGTRTTEGYADTGGASRYFHTFSPDDDPNDPLDKMDAPFFYHAKTSRSEREAGCEELPAKSGAEATDSKEGQARLNSPRTGAGRSAREVRCTHPTVKPLSLMRHLVRLVARSGSTILDPFAGSGTTLCAAVLEGFNAIGIEKEPEYLNIARARVAYWSAKTTLTTGNERDTSNPINHPTEDRLHMPQTPHVVSLRGDIKGFGPDPVILGPRTLFIGVNGAGKSARVNLLELALGGFVSDMTGRAVVKDEGALMALSTDGSSLHAAATLSDGRVSSWRTERRSDGGVKTADHIRAIRAVFPVQAVREALTGSVDKAREFLFANATGTVTRDDVLGRLDDRVRDAYSRMADGFAVMSESARLLAVVERAAKNARDAKKAQTGADATVTRMGSGLGPEPTAEQLADAEQAVEAARLRLSDIASAFVGYDMPTLRLVAERALGTFMDAKARVESLREQDTTRSAAPDIAALGSALVTILEAHMTHGMDTCLVCTGALGDTAGMKERIEILRSAGNGRTNGYSTDANVDAKADMERARDTATRLAESLGYAEALIADGVDGADPRGQADRIVRTAEATLVGLRDAARDWGMVRTARGQVGDYERDHAAALALADACRGAVASLLDSAISDFTRRVQVHLPAGDVFGLTLRDGEREVCRFGFLRPGAQGDAPKLHTALSGAEWARLMLAIACACASDESDSLNVFIPEERAFDPDMLAKMMAALRNAPGQVILTSPVGPRVTPEGWLVVDVGTMGVEPAIGAPTAPTAPVVSARTRTCSVCFAPFAPRARKCPNGHSSAEAKAVVAAGAAAAGAVAATPAPAPAPVSNNTSDTDTSATTLRDLGWTLVQIGKMSGLSIHWALANRDADPKAHSVIRDGSLFHIGKGVVAATVAGGEGLGEGLGDGRGNYVL
jgi:hypothetical protein